MGCFLGCLTWLVAPLCVGWPLVTLVLFVKPLGEFLLPDNPARTTIMLIMILLIWLFVPIYRIASLRRKAQESLNPVPPKWRA